MSDDDRHIETRGETRPNPRQAKFAVEFARMGGKNASEAAIRAGYAPSYAHVLLRKPRVRELVEKHMRDEVDALGVTEHRIMLRAAEWLFATPEDEQRMGYRVSENMRIKALDILARATGLVRPDKHEHKHLHTAPAVQFIIPANDRVPIDGATVIDERSNGRDHTAQALKPQTIIELPPRESEPG